MPATTGMHSPITNVGPSESTVSGTIVSPESRGFGNVIATPEGATAEDIPRLQLEAALENAAAPTAPDLTGLADIGVASFGPPSSYEAVIGTDERRLIADTAKFPWRVHASLLMTAADGSNWIGTGWFISPRTLVTAGHCVMIKHSGVPGRDGWVKKIQVMPGRNANDVPFGAITATEFWTVKGWADSGLEAYDYGAIILPKAFPQDIGHFGFGVFDDQTLLSSTANIAGYPGDKDPGTLWYDSRAVASVNADKVFYAADTAGGQSGAAVYVIRNDQRIAIAVHAYGGASANSGTRISSQVYANLTEWTRT